MLLRNRERHSRSKFGLAIFAILSLVFVGTFAIISRASADDAYWTVPGIVRGIKADATPDCSNGHSGWETASTYENSCFYKKYNDLGALGAFNLIGLSEIRNNVRINGNVVTKRLDSNQILGVSEWPEINYVRDYFNATTGFFQNSADSIVAFGSAINIEKPEGFSEDCNAGNCYITIGNSTHRYGSWQEAFWQDYEAEFLDIDQLRTDAIDYNLNLRDKYLNPDTETYPNIASQESACTTATDWSYRTICTVFNSEKISYINLNKDSHTTHEEEWGGTTDYKVFDNNGRSGGITINGVKPQGTFLVNIDAAGMSNISLNNIVINLTDGSCINGTCENNHAISDYAETAEVNIVFNIYDSSNVCGPSDNECDPSENGLYRGTIGGSNIYGMVIAPAATFSAQTIRGTVIADVIQNVNEAFQSNFYGRLVVFPKVTVQHRNPDGSQFVFPGLDTSDQVYTISEMEYSVSPLDLGEDVSYTITVAEDSAPAQGQTPDEDFVVTFIYTKDTYHLTIHHVDENGNTLFEDTGGDYDFNTPYSAEPADNADVVAGYYDIELAEGSADANGTIRGDTVVTYQYTRRKATLQVYHKNTNGDDLAMVNPVLINYGSQYSASPIVDLLDEYNVSPFETVSGIVSNETVDDPEADTKTLTITFTYTRKQFDVTVIHIVNGSEVSNTTTHNVDYGTTITTDAYLDAYPATGYTRSVSVSPDGATTVTQNTTITYTYTIKTFSFTVHHYYDGTTTSYKPDHSETLNYGAAYTATPDTSDVNYEYYLKEGDSANGNITEDTVVTYYYKKKTATLTIIDVVDGVSTTRSTTTVEYGDSIPRNDFLPAYADSHNHSVYVNPDVATVSGDVTVTYTYTIKSFEFRVHHYYENTTDQYKPDYTETIDYGGTYTAVPDTSDVNYEYHLKEGDSATGTVTDYVTVTYYYRKKTATLTIIDVVDGVSTTRSTTTVEWGNSVARDEFLSTYADSHNHSVSVSPDVTTVSGDVTVTYTYTIKTFEFRVHHYYDGTETSYKPDHTETLNYGSIYTATPNTDDINYEYYLKEGDSATGGVTGQVTVTYYYKKKTATLTIIDVVDGVSTTRSTTTVEWGDDVARNDFLPAYDASHDHSVSVSPDVTKVAGDVTVTYTYSKKDVVLTVHHLLGDGSNYVGDTTTTYKYGDPYEALPDTHDNNYEYAINIGDSATGTITSDMEVTYFYRKKTATLTIIDVVDGVSTTRSSDTVEWGDDVVRNDFLPAYDASHNHSVSVSPDVTKVAGDVTVTYTYTIKTFTLTVHHYYDGTATSYKPDHTETINYGGDYTAIPDSSDANYEYYLKEGDSATGPVTNDVTITYYYKKKTATLTIIDVVDGASTTRSTTTVEWGDDVARDEFLPAYADSHNHSVSVNPDVTKVSGDVTVTYSYTIKTFTFTVHHYYDGTTNSYKPDHSETLNYGAAYTATPDTSDINYEYHLKEGDSAAGTITSDKTVTYYYKKKTATFTVKHQDMQGNTLAPTESVTKDWGDEYHAYPAASLVGAYQYTFTGGSESGIIQGDVTIIYKYTKKAYILTVHHIYEDGSEYKPDTSEGYEHGDHYTAVPDTSDNNYEYRLKEGDSASGEITSNLEVTFIYKKKTANLTVIHIVDGEEVSNTTTTVEWGDDVDRTGFLPEYNASHDHTVTVEPDVTKVAGNVTVTYRYTIRQYTLTVHHRYENGSEYKPDVTTEYAHGATYTAVPDTSDNNYEYRLANGDKASDIILDNTEVTYIYKKKVATFIVIHKIGGEEHSRTETQIDWGETYHAHPASDLTTAYNYTTDKSESGIVSGDVTVTYTYTKKTFSVTVHHVKVDGSPFANDDTDTVEYGDSYTAAAKEDPSYNAVVIEGALVNDNITNNLVITIQYVLKQGKITVKHLDQNGSKLAEEEHYDIDYGSSYSVHPNADLLEAYDYTVDVAESDTVAGDVTITYTYTKKRYTLTVHYRYENGSQYKPDYTHEYEHGDTYTAPADESDINYEWTIADNKKQSDVITSDTEIIFVYKKKTATFTIRHLDKNGNSLVEDEVTTLNWGDTYEAHPASSLNVSHDHTVDKDERGLVAGDVTVTYTYTKKKFTLTIHHVDTEGNPLGEDTEVVVEYGDKYDPAGLASLINDYDFEVDPDTPIPEVITENGEFTLIYTKKPEVPKTYDDVIYIVVSALITLVGAGAVVLSAKKRRV